MPERGRFSGARIGVFLGGISAERAVSLRTGAAVAAALRRKGYDVREIDIRGLQKHLIEVGNLPEAVLQQEDSYPLSSEAVVAAVESPRKTTAARP